MHGKRTNRKDAFFRFPNSVARDPRLDAAALVLLAWRSTLVGKYALNEKHLMKEALVRPGSGLGKDNIREAIRRMRAADYLVRRQQPNNAQGHFGAVVERLTLPARGASGHAGQMVFRRWFDGRLTLKEMAAFIYLRAGAGKGPGVFAGELEKRFNWSRPTANKAIAGLAELGLVAKHTSRAQNGRILGVSYQVRYRSHMTVWPMATTVKKPGDGLPGNGFSGDLHTSYPLHTATLLQTKGHHVSQGETPGANRFSDNLESIAFGDERLLGWLDENQERLLENFLNHIEFDLNEVIAEIADAVPDGRLAAIIREATSGRVHRALLTPEGLYAFRYIAAFYYSTTDEAGVEPTPIEAVVWLINTICDRLSSEDGAWFNSLKLVAKRILGDAYSYGSVSERLYARHGEPRYAVEEG